LLLGYNLLQTMMLC